MDREKVIEALECSTNDAAICFNNSCYYHEPGSTCDREQIMRDALALLKEQETMLRKLQNDKDKLCLEVSEWKHKFHDAPPKFVSQGVVDQIRWERDTALSQLEQIGKCLGSKMDDIVAMLKEQEAVKPFIQISEHTGRKWLTCGACEYPIESEKESWEEINFCPKCGRPIIWEGR